jgi:N-acetyl-beta-hexosaminidase
MFLYGLKTIFDIYKFKNQGQMVEVAYHILSVIKVT